ncbi:glycoside hydrolase family 18 protein [Dichomitus squalens LYAD-421 SS1]|uniref:Glycoside hydrolase family 18 protein n=1 Tax=Dichomitus squalens (strain LYAD-421) TaxID=732165 RepID=R7T2C4_DICSQ|nr:glycoside hydrolase family 18 protein [Dichomitus squalens LYAD-421 SS1]EJF62190.1 glycoside hydrolase family 18 protein [Dichomitus squalens LYAD-421 SS1]
MTISAASVVGHTTASSPRPHILYTVEVKTTDGKTSTISKRYSEFVALHDTLNDPGSLPPKRVLATIFVPSAWLDDALITERKAGLSAYLTGLLELPQFRAHKSLVEFLTPSKPSPNSSRDFSPEDAIPSTLSRKAALEVQKGISAEATPIVAAYYPDWASDSNPPGSLDFSKFDILLFAFATPNSSSGISWDSGATSTLKTLVSAAHNSGHATKIVLSIGGWGGSYYFSQAMSTSANRTTFVNACVSAVNTYNLDGIDIDWEYPNESGAGNPFSSSDAANLLSFFKSLRTALGSSKIISAAVTQLPWTGSNGNPLTDVSAYASVMTYANIMNYDVWGASSTPGPNAPLGNLCGNSSLPQYSAQAALAQWTAAGFPASKLVLGLPLYGYVSQSTKTTLEDIARPPVGFDVKAYKEQVLGLPDRGLACPLPRVKEDAQGEEEGGEPNALHGKHERSKGKKKDVSAEASGDLSSYFGQQIPFNQIVALGALQKTSSGTYVQANGYTEGWDNCSDTPFLYNTSRKTVVTYDDTYSLGDKALFAKQNGMAGCFTWSLDQDDGYTLQNVIRSNLGL